MKAIVGLGNPGEEYLKTRHNAGFLSIDCLAEKFRANYWKDECGALVAHCKNPDVIDDEILLVKPQSFMNLSGSPVKNILEKYNLSLEDIIIIHDDMDIDLGSIRVKLGGGSAGHNGLKSIDQKLSSNNYLRVRIGIGKPSPNAPSINYVLSSPKGSDFDKFSDACMLACQASLDLLSLDLDIVQQRYNQKNNS